MTVLTYFDTAALDEIRNTLRFAEFIVKRRTQEAEANTPAPAAVTKPKPRKPRTRRRESNVAPDGSVVHPPSGL